jgi:N-acetylmuramoyl-L-alanine amidase
MLTVTTLCTAVLAACAGGNAAAVFWQREPAAEETAAPPAGPLAGLVIAVDAGHGGYDGGAVGRVSGTPEKGLNLDVAQQVEKLLCSQGADVVMTRTGDYALCDENPPIRKKLQDMQRRAEIIRLNEADMVISIHMNEYAGRSESGPQVFYREDCPAGRLLAGAIQEAMIEGLNPSQKRTALGGDYYILTLGVPSVLVECGFLSNKEEESRLMQEGYRQEVARSVVQGVVNWQMLTVQKPQALEAVDRSGEERE